MKMYMFPIAVVMLAAALISGCPKKPPAPEIALSAASLVFGETSNSLTFQVWNANSKAGKMSFAVTSTASWISSINPDVGESAGPADPVTITVQVDRSGRPADTYTGTIVVSSSQTASKSLAVSMTVPAPVEEKGVILGFVGDTKGAGLAFVSVQSDSGAETYTDGYGCFALDDEPAGTRTLTFAKAGYAPGGVRVEVLGGASCAATAALKALAPGQVLSDAAAGGTVDDGQGNAIDIPEGGLVTKSGRKATGPVSVHITPLDVTSDADMAAFPGSFMAIAAKQGSEVMLETFALADFSIFQDDEPLDLAPGSTATIQLALPEDTPLGVGEVVPLWHYDEIQGIWMESGTGTVEEVGGIRVYTAEIPHLSWWNCDAPIEQKNCITGRILDDAGMPVAGASVIAKGVDYNGWSYGNSDTNGYFCVDVKRDSTVQVEVTLPGGTMPIVNVSVTVPDASASCATGGCIAVGDIEASYDSCIRGRVTDKNGAPVAGVNVYSSIGSRGITDSRGDFCMGALAGIETTVFVIGRPPVSVTPEAGTSCGAGNCVEANISVEYPEDGDFVGWIVADLDAGQATTSLNASAFFFAGTGDTFGFDGSDTCSVHVYAYSMDDYRLPEIDPTAFIGALDPGAPGLLSANGSQTPLVRLADWMAGEPMMSIQPWMYSMFVQEGEMIGIPPGATTQFSWPGGFDIAAFSAASRLPDLLTFTSPEITSRIWFNTVDIDLSSELVLAWDASAPGDYVEVSVSSSAFDLDTMQFQTGVVQCLLGDDGSHVIPASLLSQLPYDPMYSTVMFSASRHVLAQQAVPLARTTGNGIVGLDASTGLTAMSMSFPEVKSDVERQILSLQLYLTAHGRILRKP